MSAHHGSSVNVGRNRIDLVAWVAALIFVGWTSSLQAEPAQLVIHRAANFGTRQALRVWIDGEAVGALAIGHNFRAAISPGDHVISVSHVPNRWFTPPTNLRLHARRGQLYEFTAMWRGDDVYLE